ncbi:MAG: hypothetical protein J3K34DRAFT_526893, partial [Monoraphidium minutum]
MGTPALEVVVDLGDDASCAGCSWCPANGVLAAALQRRPAGACADVLLLDPHDPSRVARLQAPLSSASDALVALSWSPPGCRRLLLVASRGGALSTWGQVPPDPAAAPRVATAYEWWCARPDLSASAGGPLLAAGGLVAAAWLAPAPQAEWDAARIRQADFEAEGLSLQSLLQREASGGGGGGGGGFEGFDWLRPGRPALALVAESGAAVLAWSAVGDASDLEWWATCPLPLPGTAAEAAAAPAPGGGGDAVADAGAAAAAVAGGAPRVVVAAAAGDGAGGVEVAYVLSDAPRRVRLARITGDPAAALAAAGGCDAPRGAPVALPVTALAGAELGAPGDEVAALCWRPGGGQLCSWARPAAAGDGGGGAEEEAPGGALHLLTRAGAPGGEDWRAGAPQPLPPQRRRPRAPAAAACLAWCPTGGAVMHAEGGVFEAERAGGWGRQRCGLGGAELQAAWRAGPCAAAALAPSPSGAAACVVYESCGGGGGGGGGGRGGGRGGGGGGARLAVWLLPEAPPHARGAADTSRLQAARLAWPLLTGAAPRDAVQALLAACGGTSRPASSAGRGGGAADNNGCGGADDNGGGGADLSEVAQVLGLVDGLVHRAPPYQVPQYSRPWDAAKLSAVAQLPGPLAEALAVDLRLRLALCQVVSPAAFCAQDIVQELRLRHAVQDKRDADLAAAIAPGDAAAAQALAQGLADALVLALCAVKAWMEALATLGEEGLEGPARAEVDALPLIRLLPDYYSQRLAGQAVRSLGSLLAVVDKIASKQPQPPPPGAAFPPPMAWRGGVTLQDAQAALLAAVAAVYPVLPSAADGAAAPQEHLAVLNSLCDGSSGSFHGALSLHYSRITVKAPRPFGEAYRRVKTEVPLLAKLPLLNRAQLMARAADLGLTPPVAPQAAGAYLQDVRLHGLFRAGAAALDAAAARPAHPALQGSGGGGGGGGEDARRRQWAKRQRKLAPIYYAAWMDPSPPRDPPLVRAARGADRAAAAAARAAAAAAPTAPANDDCADALPGDGERRPQWRAVWRRACDRLLPRELRGFAWMLLHAALSCGGAQAAFWSPGQPGLADAVCCSNAACRAAAPGGWPLETLMHALLDCPAVRPALRWLADLWPRFSGGSAPPLTAAVWLQDSPAAWRPHAAQAGAEARAHAEQRWAYLRLAVLEAAWRLRCRRRRGGQQFGAADVVDDVIEGVERRVLADWQR